MKDFVSKTGRGLCFDINHAIHTAEELEIDFMSVVRNFFMLRPVFIILVGRKFAKKARRICLLMIRIFL